MGWQPNVRRGVQTGHNQNSDQVVRVESLGRVGCLVWADLGIAAGSGPLGRSDNW